MTPSSKEIEAITKRFGGHLALNAMSLAVSPGEFVSILGPSGCGKSTLPRLIAGLDDPDAGDIRIGGVSMNATGPCDRGVAFVFQNYALYPHLSCYDNIAAPFGDARDERLRTAAVRRPRHSLRHPQAPLDRRPRARHRAPAAGRAVAGAQAGPALRHQTRAELVALQKRLGTTTIFVTHDQSEAMAMSDRIAVMFEGTLRRVGTTDELYRNPADLDVARFLSQPHLNCLPDRTSSSAPPAKSPSCRPTPSACIGNSAPKTG